LIVLKDVLDEAAPHPHGVGHFVQAPLHGSITASCSQRVMRRCLLGVHFGLIAQAPTIAGPVPAERQPVLDSGVAPDQLLARRAAVGCRFRVE